MKLVIGVLAATVLAYSQSSPTKGTATQEAKDCAQNFIGSNNIGTVTCYNVDKKLADQIGTTGGCIEAGRKDAEGHFGKAECAA